MFYQCGMSISRTLSRPFSILSASRALNPMESISAQQQEQYLANVRNEMQTQMMQELMTKVTER